jgi:molybdate transport system substrate-binding protein
MRRLAAILAALVVLAGCGSSGGSNDRPQLIVSAASSLRNALAEYGNGFRPALVRLSFGGSDELAAQIRAGGRADVFAAANTKLPAALFAEGKVERPVEFTANRLVLAVPKDSHVNALDDLAKPGIKLAIGSATVPIGSYTRQVLSGLPGLERNRILANVKTAEPDVAGIVGKLTQGAVDAGFVYATDVTAAGGSLRAVQLPPRLRPTVVYGAAVVKGTRHHAQAQAFVGGLVRGAGQAALRKAGFLPLPR